MRLKERLKQWLFKEEINDIKIIKANYDKHILSLEKSKSLIDNAREQLCKSHVLLEDCRKFMNSLCDVGTDIGFTSSDHSWAVICVHGKIDYVKFVDMRQSDVRSIVGFLKNFEYSNRITDSPLIHKDIIEREIKLW